jgi:hypothetical protein
MILKVTDENYTEHDFEEEFKLICNCCVILILLPIFISELNLFYRLKMHRHYALFAFLYKCHSFPKDHSSSLSYSNCIDCKTFRKQRNSNCIRRLKTKLAKGTLYFRQIVHFAITHFINFK